VLAAAGVGIATFVIAGALTDIVERTGLWRAQTPQMFRYELLRRGLEVFGLESLAESASAPPELEQLARRRALARERKDFDEGDRLRGEIEAAGWQVRDVDAEPGFQLVPKR